MKTDTPSARSARHSASFHSILNLLLVAFILGVFNYIGFKYYVHKDMSQSQFYTLSDKTLDTLKNLDSPVTIYTFLDDRNIGQAEQINTLLKEYQRAGGKNISVEKIDVAFDAARANELYKKLHFNADDHPVIFEYKDRSPRFVKQEELYDVNPMTGQASGFKGEQLFTSAITSLVEGKVSRVYFTEGHGEHAIQDTTAPTGFGLVTQTLKDENIEVQSLNLGKTGDVPSDADAVIIAGPAISFSPIEAQALDEYLAKNGKLFILLDPYVSLNLDALLNKYGMNFDDDLVLYHSANVVTPSGSSVTLPLAYIYQGGFSQHPITAKFAQNNLQLLIYNARSITLPATPQGQPKAKAQFLFQTDPDAWGWVRKPGAAPVDQKMLAYNKTTDIGGPMTVAAAYDGGSLTDPTTKETIIATRLVLVGCSKFLENDTADSVGANFFANAVDWLVKKQAVLDISPKKAQEYGLSLSPMQFRTVAWCSVIFIPAIALAFGIFTWFSRRK